MRSRAATGFLISLIVSGCGSDVPLPSIAKPQPADVTIEQLLSAGNRLHRARVRVIAPMRIEFEGNALYVDEEAFQKRRWQKAVWIQLGWPVSPELRALDGKYAMVEGRFEAGPGGHDNSFAAAISEITRIERSSREAQLELKRRIEEGSQP
jgi:hypothetical protein